MACMPIQLFRCTLSCALAAALLTGCALSTRSAILTYPPAPESSVVAVAVASPPPPARHVAITVLPFRDRRVDPTKVGNVRNAFGMKMAPITAVNSVPGWVREAVAYELSRAGFDVTVAPAAGDSALTVGGEVLKAEADAYMSYGAEVSLRIELREGSRELFARSYLGKGSGGANLTATAKSFAQVLGRALANALEHVATDVEQATATD